MATEEDHMKRRKERSMKRRKERSMERRKERSMEREERSMKRRKEWSMEREENSMKRRLERFKWFPIPSPKYEFECPLPEIGKSSYPVYNLGYCSEGKPHFEWPINGIKKAWSGVVVPLQKLLFTPERDFLINNSGKKFHATHLQDKILAILTHSVSFDILEHLEQTKRFIEALKAAYTELRSRNCSFEVVFVAADDAPEGKGGQYERNFNYLFNNMPWLAIPFSDNHARKICKQTFDCYRDVSCVVLQTNGYILHDFPAVFTVYGAKAFPFTYKKLEELEKQNLSFFTAPPPSMKELLGDSVFTPRGDKVLSADLENKVVGLFFLKDSGSTKLLQSAWKELKDRHPEFKIVVVYPPFEFSYIRWRYRLPWFVLDDTLLCQKLWWIYQPPTFHGFLSSADKHHPGALVVIGPQRNRFCSYYAADILYKFGAKGYPFTIERAAELEKEKLMKLELSSLLGKEQLVCAADQKKVTTVNEFLGKDVVVLVSQRSWHKERDDMLQKLHVYLKRGCISPEGCIINEDFMEWGEFPIVYISKEAATDEDFTAKDPVMLCPSKSSYLSCVTSGLLGFYDHPPQVAIFGKDGRLAAKLCWVDAEGDRKKEVLTRICNIDPVLLSQLHDAYDTTNLVGWSNLKH